MLTLTLDSSTLMWTDVVEGQLALIFDIVAESRNQSLVSSCAKNDGLPTTSCVRGKLD